MSESRDAVFSPDEPHRYRYRLTRTWTPARPQLVVIGLNPSTANHEIDDQTIRRLRAFARGWGFGGLVMLNLFALRARDPKRLRGAPDRIGPENDAYLQRETADADGHRPFVLCAWGTPGAAYPAARPTTPTEHRADEVLRLLVGRRLCHLGYAFTANRQPRHPLRLHSTTPLVEWSTGQAVDATGQNVFPGTAEAPGA